MVYYTLAVDYTWPWAPPLSSIINSLRVYPVPPRCLYVNLFISNQCCHTYRNVLCISIFANLQYSHTVMFYVRHNFANLQYSVHGTLRACELPVDPGAHTVVLADLNVSLVALRTPNSNL